MRSSSAPGLRSKARDRGKRIDRRIAALFGDGAVEHDVSVEDAAHGIGDRVIVVVAVDQHRDDRGDRALAGAARAGALEQLRQVGEHRGRIAARHRMLAGAGCDLAQRMREASDGIEHQQHAVATLAEMLGDAHRGVGRALAHHGALVAGRHDGNRLGHVLLADRVFEEFAHLAAALADQRHDHRVECVGAGQHGEQRRLADAGAGEDAEALAEAKRREDVDDPDARPQPVPTRCLESAAGAPPTRPAPRGKLGSAVDRPPERVDDASSPCGIRRHQERAAIEHGIADAGVGAALERRDEHVIRARSGRSLRCADRHPRDAPRRRQAGRSPIVRAPGSGSPKPP